MLVYMVLVPTALFSLVNLLAQIPSNPPAGVIRRKELNGVWMTNALKLQDIDRKKVWQM